MLTLSLTILRFNSKHSWLKQTLRPMVILKHAQLILITLLLLNMVCLLLVVGVLVLIVLLCFSLTTTISKKFFCSQLWNLMKVKLLLKMLMLLLMQTVLLNPSKARSSMLYWMISSTTLSKVFYWSAISLRLMSMLTMLPKKSRKVRSLKRRTPLTASHSLKLTVKKEFSQLMPSTVSWPIRVKTKTLLVPPQCSKPKLINGFLWAVKLTTSLRL